MSVMCTPPYYAYGVIVKWRCKSNAIVGFSGTLGLAKIPVLEGAVS